MELQLPNIISVVCILLTYIPLYSHTMSTDRGDVPETRTRVDIFVNYTILSNMRLHTEEINFQNGNFMKVYGRSGPSSAGVIPSAGAGATIGGSSSTGLGVPQSAFSSYPRADSTLHAKGMLIHVVNVADGSSLLNPEDRFHDACTPVINNPLDKPWIALIRASTNCDEMRQFKNVFSAKASAVIIYGLKESDRKHSVVLDPPKRNDGSKQIAVFVTASKIKHVLNSCFNSSMKWRSSPEDQIVMKNTTLFEIHWFNLCNASISVVTIDGDHFLNKTSVLFVSISFILLMIISLAWLVFYYVQRYRYIHTKEQMSRHLAHLAKKAVAKIPVKTIKQGDKETDSDCDQCAICIEPYKPSENVRILPCRHYFHKSCIDPWLLEQRSCPICKLDILHAYGLHTGGVAGEAGSLISDHGSDVESADAIGSSTPDLLPRYTTAPPTHAVSSAPRPRQGFFRRCHRRQNHHHHNSHHHQNNNSAIVVTLGAGAAAQTTSVAELPTLVNSSVTVGSAGETASACDGAEEVMLQVLTGGASSNGDNENCCTGGVTESDAEMNLLKKQKQAPVKQSVVKDDSSSPASSLSSGGLEGMESSSGEGEKTLCLRVQVERPPAHSDESASPQAVEHT